MFKVSYIFLLWYWLIAPLGVGILFVKHEKDKANLLMSYLVGMISCFSIYYIICMIFMRLNVSLIGSAVIYNIVLFLICVISLVKEKELISKIRLHVVNNQGNLFRIFLVLVCLQIVYVIITTSGIYGDDIFYVASINDMVHDNKFYSGAYGSGLFQNWIDADYKCRYTSWMPYIAIISATTKIHPLIIIKTCMPVEIVIVYYMVWWLFSEWLFDNDRKKQSLFGIFMSFITWFSAYSLYTVSKRVILYPRNGKAFLIAFILPFIFYYINYISDKQLTKLHVINIISIQIAAISCSLMSLIMLPAIIIVICLIRTYRGKNLSILLKGVVMCTPTFVCGIVLVGELIGLYRI